MKQPSPTTRIINGRLITFYSPQQIEEIIPVTIRQPAQRSTMTYKDNLLNSSVTHAKSRTGYHHL